MNKSGDMPLLMTTESRRKQRNKIVGGSFFRRLVSVDQSATSTLWIFGKAGYTCIGEIIIVNLDLTTILYQVAVPSASL